MRSYKYPAGIPEIPGAVVTTGTFDGVHRGHQAIIKRLRQVAGKIGGETVLLTFHPHPRQVLFPDTEIRLINTQEEKEELLEKAGIDHLVVIPFTRAFSRITSIEFVRDILVGRLNVSKLVIGYNHQFGRNREGSFGELKELAPLYGFEVEEIPPQEVEHVNVSSTKIRQALSEGNMVTANEYLGYEFFITGTVIHGNGKGRTIGFPTANLGLPDPAKIVPAPGVYAIRARLGSEVYGGMLNIGNRPTVGGEGEHIEAHLFGFEGDLYGRTLRISFCERIRSEKKFDGLEALKGQLFADEERSKQILGIK